MKKLLAFSSIILLLSSCLTVSRIERNCDKFAQICVTEKVTETVYRDTTIFVNKPIEVPVPGYKDSINIRDSVRIITVIDSVSQKPKQYAELDTVTKELGLIGVKAWVKYSEIGIDAWLTDSTFLYNYQDSIKLENAIKNTDTTEMVPVRYIPGFYKFTFWFFLFQLVSLVLVGIYMVRKSRQ